MELIFILSSVVLSIAISLGVGSSTIAICNFFSAIADGKIDETERQMMGVTYIVLRVAMVLIALMLIVQYMLGYLDMPTNYYATTIAYATGLATIVLYVNAVLMTYRIMPSTFGPAIQASSWYTLGFLAALAGIGMTMFSLPVFLLAYAALFLLTLSLVNSVMSWLKMRTK